MDIETKFIINRNSSGVLVFKGDGECSKEFVLSTRCFIHGNFTKSTYENCEQGAQKIFEMRCGKLSVKPRLTNYFKFDEE
jgi:hypothetical protein